MMDLESAIQHCKEQVQEQAKKGCYSCAEEHQQLAEWLKELKAYREQSGDAISRQAVLNTIGNVPDYDDGMVWEALSHAQRDVSLLPSVTPQQKTGRWIPVGYDGYADGNPVYDWWECSECGWEHTGDEESLTAFCPNCGAKMEVEE